ncbi:MAG: hypothetical protein JW829_04665 [Pirellulales bacterium]|nr:hypothetical protein [Pirellulales bacterium]
MERIACHCIGIIGFLLIVPGCGDGTGHAPTASISSQQQTATPDVSSSQESPQGAVIAFLGAVRRGDRDIARGMLTPLAIQKTEECNLHFAPPGSDTAEFQVGKARMVEPGLAHVSSVWTDSDENGQPRPENITWTVKKTGSVWRISGMIAEMGYSQPPIVINFEQPDELIRRQEMANAEAEAIEARQAKRPEDPFQATPRQ